MNVGDTRIFTRLREVEVELILRVIKEHLCLCTLDIRNKRFLGSELVLFVAYSDKAVIRLTVGNALPIAVSNVIPTVIKLGNAEITAGDLNDRVVDKCVGSCVKRTVFILPVYIGDVILCDLVDLAILNGNYACGLGNACNGIGFVKYSIFQYPFRSVLALSEIFLVV